MKKPALSDTVFHIVNTGIMLFVILLTTYPFIYIIFYSLSEPQLLNGGFLLLPRGISLEAYKQSLSGTNIGRGIFISVARSTLGPASTLFITSMVAYVLTRNELLGRKIIIKVFLFTMYFSSGMIPSYILITKLRLSGTFFVYILPYLVNVFYLILIKTYIEGIPKSLEEAALMDGANDFGIYSKVIMPICMPICAAVILFESINQWNYFQDTLFYNAQTEGLHTLQYKLVHFIQNKATTLELAKMNSGKEIVSPMTLRMSMTVITVLPIAMVYPFLQKYFIKGLMLGAVKG